MIEYQYQVLRYVHDQFTGEFANVGIIVYAPQKQFLQCHVVSRYARLSEFFVEMNGQFLLASLRRFEKVVNHIGDTFPDMFEHNKKYPELSTITRTLIPKDDSALQLTDVFSGLCSDPPKVMADLYERIIVKYNAETSYEVHTDYYVWSKVYKTWFDKYYITKKLKKHIVTTQKDEISFDKAWKNGVWNCYETLSFDLKSEDAIKSKVYKWSGIIRELETSKEAVKIYFLTSTPKEGDTKELESFIKETLTVHQKNLSINIVDENNAETFAASVREEMEKSKLFGSDKEDELRF